MDDYNKMAQQIIAEEKKKRMMNNNTGMQPVDDLAAMVGGVQGNNRNVALAHASNKAMNDMPLDGTKGEGGDFFYQNRASTTARMAPEIFQDENAETAFGSMGMMMPPESVMNWWVTATPEQREQFATTANEYFMTGYEEILSGMATPTE